MNVLVAGLATVALLSATVVLVTGGTWRGSLRVLLDLLTAAGLLRLVGQCAPRCGADNHRIPLAVRGETADGGGTTDEQA